MTVNIQNKVAIFQKNKDDRINIYLKSLSRWLNETKFKIILVENSGYKFDECQDYLNKFVNRFEIISFKEEELPDALYLKNNISKGASEIFSINYAFKNSKLINENTFIIKITGRYFIPELEEYLYSIDLNEYDAITQNNKNRCELVGSHYKNFNDIFNINLKIKSIKNYGHVEYVYKYRCLLFKNVLQCKIFTIEPTQRGGVNMIYNTI